MPEYCVTGGTGFIASHLVRALLAKGHTVRATVRDPGDEAKVGFLWSFDGAKERLRLVKADLLVEGSFDEAVDGADGVFHTASPVYALPGQNIQEALIDPAIRGTANVLNSCSKANSVRRVVLTSSCAALRYRDDVTAASPLDESHWSDLEYCKRYNMWYAYAKTLAEKEAWQLAKEYGISLVVVLPSFVVGTLLTPQPTSTLKTLLSIIKGERPCYPNRKGGFVHIDDAVLGHILAMEESRASGRLICSGSVADWSEIVEMLRAKYPSYPIPNKRGDEHGEDNPHSMDTTKIRDLGMPPFKTIPQMLDECVKSLQEKGFL
ncbi:tetraketide alpha-pyrone reductase 2-like isoform X2 [Phoenix dactylifera]|uniref:Tetraketide alpha-pyrone reductase 2-like isoform X2 n=1 Tax=Phoenix dactylifera TaxID=42345 RepID=A0A8B9APX3_PHODC|nr:tetraketide alpha-pyrone reductase 2-like isoform X2 [Phoenix dactylifera]